MTVPKPYNIINSSVSLKFLRVQSFVKVVSSQHLYSLEDFVHQGLIFIVWNTKGILSICNIDYMIIFVLFKSILSPFMKCQYLPTGDEVIEAHESSFLGLLDSITFCHWKVIFFKWSLTKEFWSISCVGVILCLFCFEGGSA